MIALFWFILIITPIVIVHELGHFAIARVLNLKVSTFSVGFGKKLLSWIDKKGTTWQLALIPLGGYVKMYGDANIASMPDEKYLSTLSQEERGYTFHAAPLWKRAMVFAAGSVANYIFAIIIFAWIMLTIGHTTFYTEITAVHQNSPAQIAGMHVGDKITSVNETKITSVEELRSFLLLNGTSAIKIGYTRGSEHYTTTIVPAITEIKDAAGYVVKQPIIGVLFEKYEHQKLSAFEAITKAVSKCIHMSDVMLKSIVQILSGKRGADDLGGPIKIAQYAAKSGEGGMIAVFGLIAVISLNLGLVNLLPIPLLDGGHLFFCIVELLFGKMIANKLQNILSGVGFVVLILLMGMAVCNDLQGTLLLDKIKKMIFNR